MNRTKIGSVKKPDGSQGYSWNPVTGCLNGCEYCYARKLANGRLKQRYLSNDNIAPVVGYDPFISLDPFYPRFWPERLDDPYAGKSALGKPKGVFVCDMSDLFGIGIPEEWTRQVLNRCRMSSQHRFYLLTKQPQNLIKFSPFPDNCWPGVTATDETMFHNACYYLEKVVASVKYISFEPLLSFREDGFNTERLKIAGINWVIIGAQTNPCRPPKLEWVQEIVEAADKAGIPVFLKNNLKPLFHKHITIDDKWALNPERDWPAKGIWRQEMPTLATLAITGEVKGCDKY